MPDQQTRPAQPQRRTGAKKPARRPVSGKGRKPQSPQGLPPNPLEPILIAAQKYLGPPAMYCWAKLLVLKELLLPVQTLPAEALQNDFDNLLKDPSYSEESWQTYLSLGSSAKGIASTYTKLSMMQLVMTKGMQALILSQVITPAMVAISQKKNPLDRYQSLLRMAKKNMRFAMRYPYSAAVITLVLSLQLYFASTQYMEQEIDSRLNMLNFVDWLTSYFTNPLAWPISAARWSVDAAVSVVPEGVQSAAATVWEGMSSATLLTLPVTIITSPLRLPDLLIWAASKASSIIKSEEWVYQTGHAVKDQLISGAWSGAKLHVQNMALSAVVASMIPIIRGCQRPASKSKRAQARMTQLIADHAEITADMKAAPASDPTLAKTMKALRDFKKKVQTSVVFWVDLLASNIQVAQLQVLTELTRDQIAKKIETEVMRLGEAGEPNRIAKTMSVLGAISPSKHKAAQNYFTEGYENSKHTFWQGGASDVAKVTGVPADLLAAKRASHSRTGVSNIYNAMRRG